MFPEARVVGYQADAEARKLLAALADLNELGDRIEIKGICNPCDLETMPESEAFVMMDVEGAELELLNPTFPILRTATVLFESHHSRDVIHSRIIEPFSATHTWLRVSSQTRSHQDIKHLNWLTRWWIRKVCSSWTDERPCVQDWFLLRTKQSGQNCHKATHNQELEESRD